MLIDRIRQDVKKHLDRLLTEADKLRHARRPRPARGAGEEAEKLNTHAVSGFLVRGQRVRANVDNATKSDPVLPRLELANTYGAGRSKAKVLSALSSVGGMTAGEVAEATGLGRGTVSTTLSKLAKNGEVAKVERGYRLPPR